MRYALDLVRRWLGERCGRAPLRLAALGPHDRTTVMWQQARRYSPARAQLIATAWRSLFRVLRQRGARANDRAKAVPTVPHGRVSALPTCRQAEDVAHLLPRGERTTPPGPREAASLLRLARLGLRAGEVAARTRDDLDGAAGELLVRGKGARHDRLPLPHEVGEALVADLRHGRPPSATRRVFVRRRAPRRGFADGHAVGTSVRRALARAGLCPARKGAHLLRPALATQLLNNGASRAEIGELLRQRALETTRI